MSEKKAKFDLGQDGEGEHPVVPDVVITSSAQPDDSEKRQDEPSTSADGPVRRPTEEKLSNGQVDADLPAAGGRNGSAYPPKQADESKLAPAKESSKATPKQFWLPGFLEFARPHLHWKGMRPVIRASISAWIALLLLVIPASERKLGQATFLTLIVATINPAAYPTTFMVECALQQIVTVALSWVWSVVAIAIAHAARVQHKYTQADFGAIAAQPYATSGQSAAQIKSAIQVDIFHGAYLEPRSTIVCAVFLAAGGGFLLWLRAYLGPGPHLFAIIFAIILQCITMTIAPLFPYPYYSIGLIFFLPFICQTAVNLAITFLVLPETTAHQFADRLINTLKPLHGVVSSQQDMLHANPRSKDWLEFKSIRTKIDQAMAALALMAASEANLSHEISWSRVSGKDLGRILASTRTLASRTTGFNFFYEIVEKHLHREESESKGGPLADELIIHLAHDDKPSSSRRSSPHSSPHDSDDDATESPHVASRVGSPLAQSEPPSSAHLQSSSRNSSTTSLADSVQQHHDTSSDHQHKHKRKHKKRIKYGRSHGSHISLPPLLQEVLHPNLAIKPVGIVESQKYMDLEDFLGNPRDEAHLEEIIQLLSEASGNLLRVLDTSVTHLIETIHTLKALDRSWKTLFKANKAEYEARVKSTEAVIRDVEAALQHFRDDERLAVLQPYLALFDPLHAGQLEHELDHPSHRGLFWTLLYQWVLIGWSEALLKLLKDTAAVEKKRTKTKLWWPNWAKARFRGNHIESAAYEDADPDRVPGLEPSSLSAARNPDYRPPKTRTAWLGVKLYDATNVIASKDFLFGLKAAILIGLISLPAYLRSSCFFFYRERGIWVLIMSALTLNQAIGDTTFNFVVRIGGTFFGAVAGMVIWYIGAGNGHGSYYGLPAICAVAFPFIMFYRIYQQPPVSAILPPVTTMLVIGYSWQNANQPTLSAVGYGFAVAWRRFVAVMIGITAAFLWSFLPPKVTQKERVRKTYANVVKELGTAICQVVSFANCKKDDSPAPKVVVKNIGALRAQTQRTMLGISMIRYEVSLRGPWPTRNYLALKNLILEMLDLIGQLLGVLASLKGAWVRAVMQRTQLSNSRFLGDMLVSLQLVSTALAQGTALPMIYNPLVERFLRPKEAEEAGHPYGFEVMLASHQKKSRHDGGESADELPEHVNWDTIKKEEYMRFSTACSLVYALVNRIDRLMVVTKSLVGESYTIYGVDSLDDGSKRARGRRAARSRLYFDRAEEEQDEIERREREALLFAPDSTRPSFEDDEQHNNDDRQHEENGNGQKEQEV